MGSQSMTRSVLGPGRATPPCPWQSFTWRVEHQPRLRRCGVSTESRSIKSTRAFKPELADPQPLRANANRCFGGCIILGTGFTLTPEERNAILSEDPASGDVIKPYLGGEEFNESPTQAHERYVVDFGERPESEARRYRLAFERVERLVRPAR